MNTTTKRNNSQNDLHYVLAVTSTKSVRKASKKLRVPKEKVLQHIKNFEKKVGSKVFRRTRKGYILKKESASILLQLNLIKTKTKSEFLVVA